MNKKVKLIILILIITLVSGCTKYMQDDDKKIIKYEKTGQNITSNILCKPTNPELIKIYEKNKDKMEVKLKDLPNCTTFKPSDIKYKGIWESVFVKPLAWSILKFGEIVKNYGVSVMMIGLLIRIALLPLSKKTLEQSKKMKEMQPEINKLEKKYKDKTDTESLMAKSQEMQVLYKKYGINPMSGCLTSLLQLPFFFAFLEAVNRVPAIFEEKLFTLQLGTTPLVGIKNGNYLYVLLIILIIISTYFSLRDSLKSASTGQNEQEKQTKYMVIFMLVFMTFASFSLPTAIALYWIVTSAFGAIQSTLLKQKEDQK